MLYQNASVNEQEIANYSSKTNSIYLGNNYALYRDLAAPRDCHSPKDIAITF